jgi:hypothetical protein
MGIGNSMFVPLLVPARTQCKPSPHTWPTLLTYPRRYLVKSLAHPAAALRGWAFGYDLLATFGRYSNGVLDLPSIGLSCAYNPGTITGLMGKVLIHGVKLVNGERFCFAQFVQLGVFLRAFPDTKEPQPPHLLDIDIRANTVDFEWERFQGMPRTYTFTPMSINHEL